MVIIENMEIRISYSQMQLDSAVQFISDNNQAFLGKDEEILSAIKEGMISLAKDVNSQFYGTMGFNLIADRDFEGLDSDENVCRVEICVDPSIHLINELDEDDFQDQIINIPAEEILTWK